MSTTNVYLALFLLLGACKPPPDPLPAMPLGDPGRGREAVVRVGCAACHTIPGIRWPQGKSGPPLYGLAKRSLIAGGLPNRPDVLAAFVQDAPAMIPGTKMPAMPLTEEEARDVAAYLYALGAS